MQTTRYDQITDGDWVEVRSSGWKLRCCDCGLIHEIKFRIKHRDGKKTKHDIQARFRRLPDATRKARARLGVKLTCGKD